MFFAWDNSRGFFPHTPSSYQNDRRNVEEEISCASVMVTLRWRKSFHEHVFSAICQSRVEHRPQKYPSDPTVSIWECHADQTRRSVWLRSQCC